MPHGPFRAPPMVAIIWSWLSTSAAPGLEPGMDPHGTPGHQGRVNKLQHHGPKLSGAEKWGCNNHTCGLSAPVLVAVFGKTGVLLGQGVRVKVICLCYHITICASVAQTGVARPVGTSMITQQGIETMVHSGAAGRGSKGRGLGWKPATLAHNMDTSPQTPPSGGSGQGCRRSSHCRTGSHHLSHETQKTQRALLLTLAPGTGRFPEPRR